VFNQGEIIICIDKKYKKKYNLYGNLCILATYNNDGPFHYSNNLVFLKYKNLGYNANYFITLKEYRKRKLNKL